MKKIALDNKSLIQSLLKIRDKRGVKVPFKLNVAQLYYWKRKTRRNLIVKARQKGLSKVIDADQLIDCIKKSTNAVVISHERESTKRLFAAVKYYIDNMEVKPALSIDSKQEMRFPKRDSYYFIGTAGQKAFGRGDTVDRAHLSEAAFYDDLEKILAGIAEAAEYGTIDIETTPNGRDQIYDMWQKIKAGKSPYTAIFIPWFIDQEYSVDSLTTKEKEGLSDAVRKMFAIPDDQFIADLTAEEKLLVKKVAEQWKIILTAGQMKWRRYKIWDKGGLFWQEYPEDEVSCFLQSGRSVFSQITTDPSKRIDMENFDTLPEEFRLEMSERQLYAGVDCAEGTLTGDRHVFSVIDVPDPAKGVGYVIYEYASNEPIDIFWTKIGKLLSNPALQFVLGIEKNGVGVAHVNKAMTMGLSFNEWTTTAANRSLMITDLEEAYRKGDLVESYPEAENEARDMFYNKSNRAEHRSNKHDDRVFSRAIAWQQANAPVPRISRL